ncbi:MAG: signal peptidase I [Peptostreptococcaceae bacterium]
MEWVKIIASALVLSFVITQFVKPTLVKGESMYPTLEENDYLIVNRITHRFSGFESGDIIVFSTELLSDDGKSNKDLVKRVIAVEGDKIKIENSNVYVNDVLIDEPYITDNQTDGVINLIVGEDEIFVMGDNRERSLDSRHQDVGLVKETDVMGKVFIRLFPFNKIGLF